MRFMSKKMMGVAGGIMNVGKSNAKLYNVEKKTGVAFADVAGQDEAKESLVEIVDFLHNPDKYIKIGAELDREVLSVIEACHKKAVDLLEENRAELGKSPGISLIKKPSAEKNL